MAPRTTAQHVSLSICTQWIFRDAVGVKTFVVVIFAPFRNVAVHVVQTPRVRRISSNFRIVLIVNGTVIYLISGNRLAKVKRRLRPCPTRAPPRLPTFLTNDFTMACISFMRAFSKKVNRAFYMDIRCSSSIIEGKKEICKNIPALARESSQ
jgi:hypothetical protein